MPLIVPNQASLPIYDSLVAERVPVIDVSRAENQDIRPLRIGLLNLMPAPVQERTEIQFFRLLGNTPLQITPVLLRFDRFTPRSNRERMEVFYEKWSTVRDDRLDGLIVTGANLERRDDGSLLEYEEIRYVDEWRQVLDWARETVTSTIYSCLASHFALEHFHGVRRVLSPDKIFGVYLHTVDREAHPEFVQGMNDLVPVPHSRWGTVLTPSIRHPDLRTIMENDDCGWHMIIGRGGREIYLQGHPEYDREDLAEEYHRDKAHGQRPPCHYYPGDDETLTPVCNWKADASVFYRNWVNYVYQTTCF